MRAIEKMVERGDGNQPINNPAVIVSQNMLRVCLEEAIGESSCAFIHTPEQAESYLAELGVRMAAYCISAAPMERQADLAQAIASGLSGCVSSMRAKGFVIRCEWNFGQGWTPNIPPGGMQ